MSSLDSDTLAHYLQTTTDPERRIDILNALTAHSRHTDMQTAWDYNHQAITACQQLEIPYLQGQADAYYWRGKLYLFEAKYHLTLETIYQALEVCSQINPEKSASVFKQSLYIDGPDNFLETGATITVIHNILGVTLTYLEQFDEALLHYLTAWKIAEAEDNGWLITLLCNNIGFMYRDMDQPDEAKPYLEQGLQLITAFESTKAARRLKATMLDKRCWVATKLGQYDLALEYGAAAFAIYQELHWMIGQAENLCRMGYVYMCQQAYDQALDYFIRSCDLSRNCSLYKEMMTALVYQAQVYIQQALPQHALSVLFEALKLADFSQQKTYESHALLSTVYESLEEWQRSLNHYKQFHDLKQQAFTRQSDQRLKTLQTIHRVEQAQAQALRYYTRSISLQQEIEAQKQRQVTLEYQAQTDPLTGIYNRRHFFECAHREWEKALRYQRPTSLLMLDIDFFKRVNDTHGHPIGDRILYNVAQRVLSHIRIIDIFGRYGGEEFILLLPETQLPEAVLIAERIRSMIADYRFEIHDITLHITVSIGVAEKCTPADQMFDNLLARTDEALLKAKDLGRNQVFALSIE